MPDFSRLLARNRALEAWVGNRAQQLLARLPRLGVDENTLLLGFAAAIGVGVGLAVILFYKLIDLFRELAVGTAELLGGIGGLSILLVVLVGLVLTRVLVRFGTNDSDGENIPDVMRAVAKRGGVVRSLPVVVKTVASAMAIGAGGAVGAEGPMAVAGSALGSKVGRIFRSGPSRLKVLVACGAAAGISAAFNAPIGGVFFALEKVVGNFGVASFPPVLVASVLSAVIARAAFGNSPVIDISAEYGVGFPGELVLYALLGVVTGLVAVLYSATSWSAVPASYGIAS